MIYHLRELREHDSLFFDQNELDFNNYRYVGFLSQPHPTSTKLIGYGRLEITKAPEAPEKNIGIIDNIYFYDKVALRKNKKILIDKIREIAYSYDCMRVLVCQHEQVD